MVQDENFLIIRRNGELTPFNKTKIRQAVIKAMKGGGVYLPDIARLIANDAENYFLKTEETPTVAQIELYVYNRLIHYGQNLTAKAYENYRAIAEFKRQANTTDEGILGITRGDNIEVRDENSNKNATIASTQRDLIAGETSKDIARRKLYPTNIIQAHDAGVLHLHDLDYSIHRIFNCCLVNIKDMLDNGTVIQESMVESPKSFQVGCTVLTQIIAQVASSQYGGQSIAIKHLGKYLKRSEDKFRNILNKYLKDEKLEEEDMELLKDVQKDLDEIKQLSEKEKQAVVNVLVKVLLRKELRDGVQTIQYQINTISSTNGQTPFVTLFLQLDDNDEYIEYTAQIIHEILRQRFVGTKNRFGHVVTPTFPKLIYVLDENNIHPDSKYRYVTDMAIKCSARRMYPDYISAKVMREIHNGEVFSCMGCRSFLSEWIDPSTGLPKWEGRFNQGVVSINLPQIGLACGGDMEIFWETFDQRLDLCKEALICRHKLLEGTKASVSPIHWVDGAIARLNPNDTIDELLHNGYSTISLGYIGLYELTKIMLDCSHTAEKGKEFALEVMQHMKDKCNEWKEETGLGFGLYGTPAESLCYRFCRIDKATYGSLPGITDKDWYTNSYHVCPTEEIDAFDKLAFEAPFQELSSGGCISYIEVPNMENNLDALSQIVEFMYNNIQYAEINTRADDCGACGWHGEAFVNADGEWECPNCGCTDRKVLTVTRRTCGYLGSNRWNKGKTKEITERVLHVD